MQSGPARIATLTRSFWALVRYGHRNKLHSKQDYRKRNFIYALTKLTFTGLQFFWLRLFLQLFGQDSFAPLITLNTVKKKTHSHEELHQCKEENSFACRNVPTVFNIFRIDGRVKK